MNVVKKNGNDNNYKPMKRKRANAKYSIGIKMDNYPTNEESDAVFELLDSIPFDKISIPIRIKDTLLFPKDKKERSKDISVGYINGWNKETRTIDCTILGKFLDAFEPIFKDENMIMTVRVDTLTDKNTGLATIITRFCLDVD